ncbi:MAG: hypothetical protein IT563_10100 [Alphaproteobacteria bacterium]|nr:hypothetical protein [Alphaproteobacteria bacterium]
MHEFTLRPGPASWRGRGSPRFILAGDEGGPVWPVLGLAVVALAAAAGLAVWMLTTWPAA